MSKLTLVTGGCRSGKSKYGENLLKHTDDVLYIATDDEMKHRIEKHKESRNKKWKTLESYKDLHKKIERFTERYVFLDCVTIMTTNLMFEITTNYDDISDEEIDKICDNIKNEFTLFLEKCKELDKEVVLLPTKLDGD